MKLIADTERPGTTSRAYSIRLAQATKAMTTLTTPGISISATVNTAKANP